MHGERIKNFKVFILTLLKEPNQNNNCEMCDVCSTNMCNKFTHIFFVGTERYKT